MPRVLPLDIVMTPVSALSEHPSNPREGDVGAIVESLDANGFYGLIVAQRSTGHILAGNHRFRAAVMRGMDTVPVQWVDVDDEHAMRILLVDNRSSDRASYDNTTLLELLEQVPSLTGTGYTDDDLRDLKALVEGAWLPNDKADVDATPPDNSMERWVLIAPREVHDAIEAALKEIVAGYENTVLKAP